MTIIEPASLVEEMHRRVSNTAATAHYYNGDERELMGVDCELMNVPRFAAFSLSSARVRLSFNDKKTLIFVFIYCKNKSPAVVERERFSLSLHLLYRSLLQGLIAICLFG